MTGQKYREALARAAQAIRAERGYKSVAAFVRETPVSDSTARTVEGSKGLDGDLQFGTLREYAAAVGVTVGQLLTRADELYMKKQSDYVLAADEGDAEPFDDDNPDED